MKAPLRSLLLPWTLSFALLLTASPTLVASAPATGGRVYRIAVLAPGAAADLARIRALGLLVDNYEAKTGLAYLTVSDSDLTRLARIGFEPRILEDTTTTDGSLDALSDYHDEAESDAEIDRVASAFPSIARRLEYDHPTEEGRVIGLLEISDNVEVDEPEPRILFVSQHHAREVMTPEVMIDMMDYLTENYGIDPEVTEWVDNYQIYIIPVHNPDGVHHVFNVDSNWRKNRRDNGDGSFGVDPNRNYPYLWGPDGCGGSSGSTSSDTYRGPSAASEPETQGITELAHSIDPSISLTYHTYGELVLHPFGCSPNKPDDPDLRAHRDLGSMLAASIENDSGSGWYEMGTPYELLYDVDGDSDGWLHAVAGTVGFTIEMNASIQGFQPDYDTWRDDTVIRNREGWKYLLRRLSRGAVRGQVRDACSASAVEAEVGLVEQFFSQGQEPRTALPGHGFFQRILVPGEYTWYAEATGYRRQEWPISVGHENVRRDIWLVPDGSFGLENRGLRFDDAAGDGDGELDPGEEGDLILTALASGGDVSGITAHLTTEDPYLEILEPDATFADLAGGDEGESLDSFRIRVLPDAPDGHPATVVVAFSADQSLCRDGGEQTLNITKGFEACPFVLEPLDQDPGWTAEGPPDGWEFGLPQGSGGTGGPDQAHTGDNVYGTNLSGNYGTSEGEFVLTTTPFDLQGLRHAELRYRRWLNNEPGYDLARIAVSTDGENWTEVWRGFGRDARWEEYRIDLPDEVDDQDRVWLRFMLRQDGGGSRSGFYIDDISFCGESALTAGGKLKYDSHTIYENDPNYGNADGEVDAGETVTMEVTLRSTRDAEATGVSAVLSTTDPGVTIHNDVAEYPVVPAGGIADSMAPHFTYTTGPDCAEKIPFALETRDDSGATTTSHFTVPVGTLEHAVLFHDDMEADTGWSVSGDATDGTWEWGDPYGSLYDGEWANPDEDHTPDPGVKCWVTQNVQPPVIVPPTVAEVDGETILTTPPLAAGPFETLELSYWRWFFTGDGPGPDTLRVEVTADGINYRTVETVSTKANTWTEFRKELSELVSPTDDLAVRFVATDGGGESIVEAGVDDVRFEGDKWVCEPFDEPLLDPPNPVGDTLRLERRGFDLRLDWQVPPEDAGHGPATFYSIQRSGSPDGGFTEQAQPTATWHYDLGVAGPSDGANYFYLVSARNSGGGEAP